MKDNFRRAIFLKWIDTDLARIAMILGFTVDIISLMQLVFVFRLFVESSANAAFSKGLGSSVTFSIWENNIFRAVSFVIILFSIVVFPIAIYKNRKKEFLKSNQKALDLINIPFREHTSSLFDEDFRAKITIDQLALFEGVFICLIVFPPVVFLWLRVFYINSTALLWFAIFYSFIGVTLTSLLYKKEYLRDSIIITMLITFTIFGGFLIARNFNLILVPQLDENGGSG